MSMLFNFVSQNVRVKFAFELLQAHLMGQYCFAGWRLLSSSVTLLAGGRAGRRARGCLRAGGWAVGRPTLHGGPVR